MMKHLQGKVAVVAGSTRGAELLRRTFKDREKTGIDR